MARPTQRASRIGGGLLGVGSSFDDLAAELLVRMLRTQTIDARHFSSADMNLGLPPGADPDGVSLVYLVSAFPGAERARADSLSKQVRELLPRAYVVRVFCPGFTVLSESGNGAGNTEPTVNSLGQAIEICMSWQEVRNTRNPTPDLNRLMSRDLRIASRHYEGRGRELTEEVLQ